MKRSTRVTIIGAGQIGKAISYLLAKTSASVEMWDIVPNKVSQRKKLSEIIPESDIVFVCVPSWSMRDALLAIAPYLLRRTIIASVAKGIESKTHLTIDELIAQVLPGQPFALLAGPMLAKEIMEGKSAGAVIAAAKTNIALQVEELFAGTRMTLQRSSDVRGAALAGVLKNVYAIGFGIADGLSLGANQNGILMTQAIKEMQAILKKLGGHPETVGSLAGIGDLVATSSSSYSTNHRLGLAIVKTGSVPFQTEGSQSLPSVIALLGKKASYPLLEVLAAITKNGKNPEMIFKQYVYSK